MPDIFTIHALPASYGDALWIEYGPEEDPYRLLIDAGTTDTFKRLSPLLAGVKTSRNHAFEALVVTHIDADHIGGVLPILEHPELPKLFADIWFNGRNHLIEGGGLSPFGAKQGERLSRALVDRAMPWNDAFNGKPIVTKADGTPVLPAKGFPGGMKCMILSPSPDQLARLLPKWDKEVREAGLVEGQAALKPKKVEGLEGFGPINLQNLADRAFTEDSAHANGSSIAMLLEYKGHRVLLGADAFPSVLLKAIEHVAPGEAKLPLSVFKLPHHGSRANVSKELIAKVPAVAYIVSTNGKLFDHPDREAMARAITAQATYPRMVAFNYDNKLTRFWATRGGAHKCDIYYGNAAGIKLPMAVD